MGIYDREYYRRDGPSFLGSLTERGKICKTLILINVAIFVVQVLTGGNSGWFTEALVLSPADVLHGQVWRLLTYSFLHDAGNNIWHILFNMLFLWWFGTEVEEMYGQREFLVFYLIAALLGGLAFTGWALALPATPELPEPLQLLTCLGASGAVTAVLVVFACHFPNRVIYLMFFLPVPIWLFVVIMVGMDAFGFLSGSRGATAVVVHLAGAGFAFLYYKKQLRLLDLWSWAKSRRRSRPRLRVYHEEVPATPVRVAAAPAAADVDEHLEAKLDAVLEKVARSGQESLTESEREILFRASEVYRRRRS